MDQGFPTIRNVDLKPEASTACELRGIVGLSIVRASLRSTGPTVGMRTCHYCGGIYAHCTKMRKWPTAIGSTEMLSITP